MRIVLFFQVGNILMKPRKTMVGELGFPDCRIQKEKQNIHDMIMICQKPDTPLKTNYVPSLNQISWQPLLEKHGEF